MYLDGVRVVAVRKHHFEVDQDAELVTEVCGWFGSGSYNRGQPEELITRTLMGTSETMLEGRCCWQVDPGLWAAP